MTRKKTNSSRPLPDGWTTSDRTQIHGRWVERGTEVSVRGLRGRYRFIQRFDTPKSSWLQVWGGPKGYEHMHAVYPDRIKTVHYKVKMRGSK